MHQFTAIQSIDRSIQSGAAKIIVTGIVPRREDLILACREAQQGSLRAREQVVRMTCRLAFTIARSYYLQWHTKLPASCDFDDVFQAALEGIIRALKKYDPDSGNAFTTYAQQWIRNKVQRCIYAQATTWKVPERVMTSGLHPNDPLLATQDFSITFEVDSKEGKGDTLEQALADEDARSIEDLAIGAAAARDIMRVLRGADRRLPAIADMYQAGSTAAEIGDRFGISSQRITSLIKEGQQALIDAELAEEPAVCIE